VQGKGGGARGSAWSDIADCTKYFKDLFAANKAGRYHGDTLESHCNLYASLFPEPDQAELTAAAWLGLPFTETEVQAGISLLSNGKAAGVDGAVADL
jgi:hypothetical protein